MTVQAALVGTQIGGFLTHRLINQPKYNHGIEDVNSTTKTNGQRIYSLECDQCVRCIWRYFALKSVSYFIDDNVFTVQPHYNTVHL